MSWTDKHLEQKKNSGRIRGYKFNNDGSLKKKRKSKYGNQKVTLDGITFDSKKEAGRYHDLKVMQMGGDISELKLQVEFKLAVEGKKIASYFADFTYKLNGELVVEDVKSSATRKIRTYIMKKKLMEAIYKIQIKEV